MDEQLTGSLVAILCTASSVIVGLFLLQAWLQKTRAARKRIQAQIRAYKISQGQYDGHKPGEWVRVGEYDICVHRVTEQVRGAGSKKERILFAEVEYRNESGRESLSCRRNQWRLYASDGRCYEVTSSRQYHGEKHDFGSDCYINPGMNVRGWLAFQVSAEARIVVLQFLSAHIGTKTADIHLEGAIETEAPAEETPGPSERLERIFPTLNEAAGDFLRLLSNTDFKGDLTLAAGMAGLKMLRNSGADLGRHTPGHILLGAIPDEAYSQMQRFILSWSLSNGLPVEGFGKAQIPNEDKACNPRVVQLEPAFDAVCQRHGLQAEDTPYAAALAALKLVAAGQQLNLMDAKTGQYMTYFHIVSGSKMVPERLSYADMC